jgi:hypothetical protein
MRLELVHLNSNLHASTCLLLHDDGNASQALLYSALLQDPPDQPGYNWVWSPQGQVQMHQPETWGYLQFSDAPADPPTAVPLPPAGSSSSSASSSSSSDAGGCGDEFRPDVTWPARALLMDVYHAQTQCWQVSDALLPTDKIPYITIPYFSLSSSCK